jgi:fatty-acyl-CoA synthase
VDTPAVPTVTGLLLARAAADGPGLLFEDRRWTWREHVAECARYAAALRARRDPGRPFHVGVLAENVPEFSFLLGGCALAGAVLVALNPVRRGAALAADAARTDCQYVLTEPRYADLLPATDRPVLPLGALDLPDQSSLDAVPAAGTDLLMLIFTSGTSGEPKAVRCTHAKIAVPGLMLAGRFGLTPADTVYVSMPMFHSNAVMAGWAVGLAAGAAIALRRRFSASGFLPDVRAFGATYANYVGKPLSYVLATPARPDDADNPLRLAYGNEGAPGDLARFAERFGCVVVDGFGSSEGGVSVSRTPDTPPGALGRLADGVALLNPETGEPCPPGRFSPGGELLNPAAAVGEFVNTSGAGLFAGYYNDPAADAGRMRDGRYWSGDLGYADADGFCYFAGRAGEWLRVDGENLGTAPIERALRRHPAVAEAAVYGVPDPVAGDQIMACLTLRNDVALTPDGLGEFLAAQRDLGPRQHPRFVRIARELPRTPTFKVLTRVLAADRWHTADPVWWRPAGAGAYVVLDADAAAGLDRRLLSRCAYHVMIGSVMTEPIRAPIAGSRIRAVALADLLGHWPAADGPLYRLLASRIARLADTGELSPGLRLPAERELAAALSVSRNTVAAAYQLLRDEGMADSRQGAGTRIVPHLTTPAAVHRANGFFTMRLADSDVVADLSVATVDCAPQVAAALTDPASLLSRPAMREVTESTGYFPYGLRTLREALAGHLTRRLGLPATAGQVLVTTGGQQAIDLLVRSEVLPGQTAVVEDPTFPGVIDALHRSGASVIGIPADDGLDPDRLEHAVRTHRPALVYLIATHHNPTGLVLPASRRERVARLAADHPDTLFVDDIALAELRLRDAPAPPPLAAIPSRPLPNLVSVGSVSKLYWGGLRTGWVCAGQGLIGRLAAVKSAADLGSQAFGQAVLAALLDDQHDDVVKWRADWLRARYEALTSALGARLPEWSWPVPDGGLTLWIRLPDGIDGGVLTQAALRHGVAIVPGRLLSAAGRPGASRRVRLAFTQPPQILADAAGTLARVQASLRRLRRRQPSRGDQAAGDQLGRAAVGRDEQCVAGQVQHLAACRVQAGVHPVKEALRDRADQRAGRGDLLKLDGGGLDGLTGAAFPHDEHVAVRLVHPFRVVAVRRVRRPADRDDGRGLRGPEAGGGVVLVPRHVQLAQGPGLVVLRRGERDQQLAAGRRPGQVGDGYRQVQGGRGRRVDLLAATGQVTDHHLEVLPGRRPGQVAGAGRRRGGIGAVRLARERELRAVRADRRQQAGGDLGRCPAADRDGVDVVRAAVLDRVVHGLPVWRDRDLVADRVRLGHQHPGGQASRGAQQLDRSRGAHRHDVRGPAGRGLGGQRGTRLGGARRRRGRGPGGGRRTALAGLVEAGVGDATAAGADRERQHPGHDHDAVPPPVAATPHGLGRRRVHRSRELRGTGPQPRVELVVTHRPELPHRAAAPAPDGRATAGP